MLAAACLATALLPAAEAPDRIEWLRHNAVQVRSLASDDDDFSDLQPLLEAIGDSRVVLLGENTHGDGSTFRAKTRLIKFLHQAMGFEVLAWESGLFDVQQMQQGLRVGKPGAEAARVGLYQDWSTRVQTQALFDYLSDTQDSRRPLLSVGFDSRVAQPQARAQDYPEYIFSFFDRLDPRLISAQERERFRRLSEALVPAEYYRHHDDRLVDPDIARVLLARLQVQCEALAPLYSPAQIDYARRSLISLIGMSRGLTEHPRFTRDTVMAENLLWLIREVYPRRKFIVWAHNFHVMTAVPGAAPEAEADFNGPMGRLVKAALGDMVYVVGFASWDGAYAYVGQPPVPIPPSSPGCMETLLHAVGHPYLFLDGRRRPANHWLRRPMCARMQFYTESTQDWTRYFDALFYIDRMQPARSPHP